MKLIYDKRVFIIDSYIYIFKSFYYYRKFYKKNYILLVIFNLIINILIYKKPTNIILVFDSKLRNNYKKKFFINYKSTRKKISKIIINNIKNIKKNLKKININYITLKNYEADEIIGNIVKYNEKNGFINYIYSEDKDLYQLITEKTFIIKKNNNLINKKYILEKYNIKNIKQFIYLISLIGDKSDNIPGIPNIGIKTANKLLNKYKSINNIYKNINDINNNKIKYNLIKYKYLLSICMKLIKIKTNIKLNIKNNLYFRKKIKFIYVKKIYYKIKKNFFYKKFTNLNINYL
ncbi:MAG: hypothetical protein RDO_0730 [Flavobacteriales endosymbiont of Rhyzopertha dominica]|nr:MAG: hypothetical protein NHG05_00910 [Candidatus Shikimatogenerans bostrichidophilus]